MATFLASQKSPNGRDTSNRVALAQGSAEQAIFAIYPPREDSYLLAKYVKKYARGKVLEIGTGSGIQSVTAAKKKAVSSVLAVDINPKVIAHCKASIKNKKIIFKQSNLFSKVSGRFDTILFNPPYLPAMQGEDQDTAWAVAGGRRGHETLERFITQSVAFLKPKGIILIIFSSLTNKCVVDTLISHNRLDFEQLEIIPVFMEKLYCYKLNLNPALLAAEKKGITNITYFSHGKRGLIFTGKYRKQKVAVKIKKKESQAVGRIGNEARWLKLINKHNIGPKLLLSSKDFVAYRFVHGDFILKFIEKNKKEKIRKALRAVLEQCITLDRLGITKEEMHHPLKHIIISKSGRPTLIDFERAHKTKKPKNVTQFLQFLSSICKLLETKKLNNLSRADTIRIGRQYKLGKISSIKLVI